MKITQKQVPFRIITYAIRPIVLIKMQVIKTFVYIQEFGFIYLFTSDDRTVFMSLTDILHFTEYDIFEIFLGMISLKTSQNAFWRTVFQQMILG